MSHSPDCRVWLAFAARLRHFRNLGTIQPPAERSGDQRGGGSAYPAAPCGSIIAIAMS